MVLKAISELPLKRDLARKFEGGVRVPDRNHEAAFPVLGDAVILRVKHFPKVLISKALKVIQPFPELRHEPFGHNVLDALHQEIAGNRTSLIRLPEQALYLPKKRAVRGADLVEPLHPLAQRDIGAQEGIGPQIGFRQFLDFSDVPQVLGLPMEKPVCILRVFVDFRNCDDLVLDDLNHY